MLDGDLHAASECVLARGAVAPAVEPASRGGGVDAAEYGSVLPRIEEDVADRVSHLPWGSQDDRVKAPDEHRAFASEDSVHCAGEAGPNALHARRQCLPPRRLDDEVRVVALDGVVDETEAATLAGAREASTELANQLLASKRRQPLPDAERDVDGAPDRHRLAGAMQDARSFGARPTGAVPRAAASSSHSVILEAELPKSSRHVS